MMTVLLTKEQIIELVERLSLADLMSLNARTGHTRGDAAYILAASQWFADQKFWKRGKHKHDDKGIVDSDSGAAGTRTN